MLKKFLVCGAVVLLFAASGCTVGDNSEMYIPTIEALQAVATESAASFSNQQEELMSEKSELEADLATSKSEIEGFQTNAAELQSEIALLEDSLNDLEGQIFDLRSEKSVAESTARSYKDLFLANTGDEVGEFVLCGNALDTEFGYENKVTMRQELAEYLAKDTSINPNTITTQHQMIWSNTDDGLIKVFMGGYMYPFIVRFENPDFGSQNSVYSLTSGCYSDFPALEANLLAISDE
jgi:hypothetical protein